MAVTTIELHIRQIEEQIKALKQKVAEERKIGEPPKDFEGVLGEVQQKDKQNP